MRSKTRQRLIKEEHEYNENKPTYEDHEISENYFHYALAMANKELIKYIDEELLLINYNNDDYYDYTESDIPLDEFTYTKNDIRVDENGKKYIYTKDDGSIIRGNGDFYLEAIVLDDGCCFQSFALKHYLKEDYNKISLEKITKSIKNIPKDL